MAKAAIIEAAPEVDQIEGVALPRAQSYYIGHEQAQQSLLSAYKSSRMHHAWILGGEKGIGKATLAFRFARFLLENPQAQDESVQMAQSLDVAVNAAHAKMVSAGSHADILHLRRPYDEKSKRFKRDLTVDEVRKTQSFFGSTAAGGAWRICIVDAADEMNTNAANALLKVLEEPPQQTLFLLVSHNPGRLLPTIRSRCRMLSMHKLKDDEILTALVQLGVRIPQDPTARAHLLMLADGSLRQAVMVSQGTALDIASRFEELCSNMLRLDMAQVHGFADLVSGRGAEDAWQTFLDLVRSFLHQQVHKHALEAPSALVRWSELWEKVSRAAADAEALNLDRKQVVLNFFMDLKKL
ncbi:DNA polymerase III subunit delta' [Polycladidibacter stylochi]|uniref:DNA polymerase III subunit delta' n=1 Tax=Polycladidibacter stylochi TaxID=1807766 RepID=UPI0008349942|nr:DNA polymerase III subunit delta' [Pseudovibrio stylochi]